MARRKTGPVTAAEGEFIKANTPRLAPEAIGAELNRTPGIIRQWIRDNLPSLAAPAQAATKAEIKVDLERSLKWQYLREELTEEEVRYFLEQYSLYVQQFKNDVLPSEQDQLFNMLKLDIAIHRNRRDVRTIRLEIDRLEDEYRLLPPAGDRGQVEFQQARTLEASMGGLRAAETARESQWLKMSQELRNLQGELKATRHQRVDKATTMKETWLEVIQRLQDDDYKSIVGTAAEHSRLATNKEQDRLARYHEFEDGTLDQPLLTAETVPEDEDEGS